jgi:hypothetical protein
MKGRYFVFWLWVSLSSALMSAQFKVVETEHLRLIYFDGAQSFLAPHVARCFENSLSAHLERWGYTPREKLTILLHDFKDYGNASASAVPRNTLILAVAPFSYNYETVLFNERINWVMNHELVHILSNDMPGRPDRIFRSIFFGKVAPDSENPLSMVYGYLTTPRNYSPVWYLEGMATFMETWMAGGLGRALSGYDEMVFRTFILENAPIFDRVGLESAGTRIDFQVGVNSYLYGTRFFNYLALQHGPEKLLRWITRPDGSKAYFASQFREVYGQSLDDAWAGWIAWEREFQATNLARLRENPITPGQPVTPLSLGSVSRPWYDAASRTVYLAVNYPGQIAHVAALHLDSGQIRKICYVKGPAIYYVTSLAYDPDGKMLFYTTDNNDWRDLLQVDPATGDSRRLMKDCRVGDLAWNAADKSLWGIRHYNGISTIVRIPPPYNEWNQVYSWPYGRDLYDIDVSPDGKWLVGALKEINGNQSLIRMEVAKLLAGETSFEVLSGFENSSPANFVFSPDGRYLFGCSYYSGVSNLYRYDLEARDIVVLSNTDTGLFHPLPLADGSLLAFRYTTQGFQPVLVPNQPVDKVNAIQFLGQDVVEKYPGLKQWKLGSPAAVDLDSKKTYEGNYRPLALEQLKSAYPIVEGYKVYPAVGWRFNISDPIGLRSFNFTASYSPSTDLAASERLHLKLEAFITNWKFTATHNVADFYDLFGPTKASRKGQAVELEYKRNLIYDEPNRFMDFKISGAGYFNLETLPDYQNVLAPYKTLFTVGAEYNYKFLRSSLGAVDSEEGLLLRTVFDSNLVNGSFYPRLYGGFDYGFQLPIRHSSIWLRSSAGISPGDRDNPFTNFYFGAFGNNWVDYQTQRRYREYYAFPGVDIDEIGGRNFGKILVEWTLPPIFFRRVGLPTCYANWASAALFTGVLATNLDYAPERRELLNVGAQIDVRFIVISHLNFTLSAGYARAFEEGHRPQDEWMVSLRIH